MNIEVRACEAAQADMIHNMYPAYLHDLSEIWQTLPNEFGVFEDDDTPTLLAQKEKFTVWWEKPGVLFPHLIVVDGRPAGFALVATPPYAPPETDYYLNEFFVLRPYRGIGAAEEGAHQVFERFRGRWELQTNPTERNPRAQRFWRRTLSSYANTLGITPEETRGHHPEDGEKLVFRFDNRR